MNEKPPDIPRLAIAYRHLVLWFGAQLFVTLASVLLQFAAHGRSVGSAANPLMVPLTPATISSSATVAALAIGHFVIFVALALYSYRTADALGSPVALLWVIAMVVPVVSLFALLLLSSRAAAICQANGIPVGLFGPKLPS
ncbi:MAG TPA: hypothetical protein VN380_02980 [Thermoanaerobaculia bacterium]|jgi:hypothetical protein|nr:hypothetical protein [Thermoanaerobaculia bacterium]